jgi:hypothetical protein
MFFRSLFISSLAIIASSAIANESSYSLDKKPSSKSHHSRKKHSHNQKPSLNQNPSPQPQIIQQQIIQPQTTIVISPKVAFGKVSVNIPDTGKINFPKDPSQYPWAPLSTNGIFDSLSKNIDFDESTGTLVIKEPGIYSVEYSLKAIGSESFLTYVRGPFKVALQIQNQEKLISKSNTIELVRLFNSVETHSLVASGSKQILLSLSAGDRVSLVVQEIPAYNGRTKEEKETDARVELQIKDKPMSLYFTNDDDTDSTTYLLLRKID